MCEEDKRKDKKEMAKNTSKLKTATEKILIILRVLLLEQAAEQTPKIRINEK